MYTPKLMLHGVATSISGVIGLGVYLTTSDWVIAAFCVLIAFPIIRVLASRITDRAARDAQRRIDLEEAEAAFRRLSDDEKTVVKAFVQNGGSVMTIPEINSLSLPAAAVETLVQREYIRTSLTADGMQATLVLDTAIFDHAQSCM